MDSSIRQQTLQLLDELPPEGLDELARFIEFLRFKYRPMSAPSSSAPIHSDIPPDSLTTRFRGFVQSPLSVAELAAAYEFHMMGDDE
jgi:hypothetical protein